MDAATLHFPFRALGGIALGLLLALPLMARERHDPLPEIIAQQRALEADIKGGSSPYTPSQASAIRQSQAIVFSTIGDRTSMEALSIDDRVALENALERIKAEVAGTDASQARTCRRETTLGSKLATRRCATQAERDQAREGGRGFMQRPRVCVPPGCGEWSGDR